MLSLWCVRDIERERESKPVSPSKITSSWEIQMQRSEQKHKHNEHNNCAELSKNKILSWRNKHLHQYNVLVAWYVTLCDTKLAWEYETNKCALRTWPYFFDRHFCCRKFFKPIPHSQRRCITSSKQSQPRQQQRFFFFFLILRIRMKTENTHLFPTRCFYTTVEIFTNTVLILS